MSHIFLATLSLTKGKKSKWADSVITNFFMPSSAKIQSSVYFLSRRRDATRTTEKRSHTLTESLYSSWTNIFQDVMKNFLSRLHITYI